MIKVSIVGKGNVSYHLGKAIEKSKDIEVIEVLSSRENLFTKVSEPNQDTLSAQPDIYILAVSDNAIVEASQRLRKTKSLVVHTSGGISITTLPKEVRRGVFYPLQTFSKKSEIDFKKVPLCIEAENKTDLEILHNLAIALSNEVHEVSSKQRVKLHLAAVFVNNFVNYMYKIGSDICQDSELPFSILKPLLTTTAQKIENLSPEEAQTGPARRGDTITIKKHLDLLTVKEHKEIYSLMTQSIQKTYGKEL